MPLNSQGLSRRSPVLCSGPKKSIELLRRHLNVWIMGTPMVLVLHATSIDQRPCIVAVPVHQVISMSNNRSLQKTPENKTSSPESSTHARDYRRSYTTTTTPWDECRVCLFIRTLGSCDQVRARCAHYIATNCLCAWSAFSKAVHFSVLGLKMYQVASELQAVSKHALRDMSVVPVHVAFVLWVLLSSVYSMQLLWAPQRIQSAHA